MNTLEIGVNPINPVMAGMRNTTTALLESGRTIETIFNKSNVMRCIFISSNMTKMGVLPNLAKPQRTMYQEGKS